MTEVRKLVGADAETWRALRLEALETYPHAFLTTHAEAQAVPQAEIAARLDGGHTYAVFEDGRAVGIGSLLPQSRAQTRHRGEIGGLFVQPHMQGRGAADALLDALIDAGHRAGIWQFELFAAARNARAIAFYRRHGFVEAGRIPNATVSEAGRDTDLLLIRSEPPGA